MDKKILSDEQKAKMRAGRKPVKTPSLEERIKESMAKDYRKDKPLVRSRAIKEKCMNCCGWQRNEVARCTSYSCPLWPYRGSKRLIDSAPPLTENEE